MGGTVRNFFRSLPPAFIAGLAILPGALAVCMSFFYLGDWPSRNRFDQVFYATIFGVGTWVVVSTAFLRGLADVRNADPAAYTALVGRKGELEARLKSLTGNPHGLPRAEAPHLAEGGQFTVAVTEVRGLLSRVAAAATIPVDAGRVQESRERALAEARALLADLEKALGGESTGSTLRWSGGSGYISLWRELHRAEEALLAAEPPESLYAEAVDDEARLTKTKVDGADVFLGEVRRLLGEPSKRRPQAEVLSALNLPEGRTIMRKTRYVLNSYRDDLFERFIRIRNAMFASLVYVGLAGVAVLALAIVALPRQLENAVAAGMAFYLVGALVGLFAELYGASKGHRGAVHDYGLAFVRLLTAPVLSGVAAVLGVVVTRLAGGASADVPLRDIFSITEYPLGIVVAAVFGLTPVLLLERLRTEANEYKEELAKSAAGTPRTSPAGG
jgi:hypothetical protein